MIAVAMTIALPAAAFAQAKPAPTVSAAPGQAGHDMKAMTCKDMPASTSGSHSGQSTSGGSGQMDQSKMDHSKMTGCRDMAKPVAGPAPADPHAGHKPK